MMDEVDRKLISQLQVDGRTTLEKLGRITGYTSMGVKKRLEKLLEENAIKVSAQMNLKHFNMRLAIVLIETDGVETTQRLLKRLEECPRIIYIFTMIGGYNVMALIAAENQGTLESISMGKCSLRSGRGIRRSEFYQIKDIGYSPLMPLRIGLTHRGLKEAPCGVNCNSCNRYKYEECVGCPATEYYRGNL
ncbi:MAG: AsnC family transcriptional regulator [Thermoproteota archaeon]|nr:AsnC family transcriptional regulator [Candidatus Brockarchaeota archaeon]